MDPGLWELMLEGKPGDEIMAMLRLHEQSKTPPDVRIIAQFGKIATCRLRREHIPQVRAHPTVASLKAPDPLVPDYAIDEPIEEGSGNPTESDRRRPQGLRETGRGVVIGVIDWGCDIAYPSFRNGDGSTRLLALWDQEKSAPGSGNNYYGYGQIYTAEEINRALRGANPYALGYGPQGFDRAGVGTHGTHVLDIAAGNGAAGGAVGIAPEADLVFVSLAARRGGFSNLGDSVTLIEAIHFVERTAGDRPWVINLSLGNMAGPHDGTTLTEQALDAAVLAGPQRAISQSCGNYLGSRTHSARQIRPGQTTVFTWETNRADRTANELEVWYSARDTVSVRLIAPKGNRSDKVRLGHSGELRIEGRVAARIYNRSVDPNNFDNHISIFLYPGFEAGAYQVRVTGDDIVDGRLHGWVERDEGCSDCQSRFSREEALLQGTTNTICNGLRTIATGAYNPHSVTFEMGRFSSMGPTRDGRQKPDLCAPGVSILAARSTPAGSPPGSGGLTRKSGTSMASPHVTGTVALMLCAALRPLQIEEIRRLLLSTARLEGIPSNELPRVGSGMLNIEGAVNAVRKLPAQPMEESSELPPYTATVLSGAGLHEWITVKNEDEDEGAEDMSLNTRCAPEADPGDPVAIAPTPDEEGLEAATGPRAVTESIPALLSEAVVGQVRFGSTVVGINANSSPAYSSPGLDDALQFAISRRGTHHLIVGNALTGTRFDVTVWTPSTAIAEIPSVIEVDAPDICTLVINGDAGYFPSSLTSRALRWVEIPRLREFYALSAVDRNAQRRDWVEKLARVAGRLAIPGVTVNRTWLNGLSMPALRLLLAQFGSVAFNVKPLSGPGQRLGSVVDGVTLPIIRYPLQEPECYLPVIAGREGKLEAINAWDMGAGISLGPIQFNLQRESVLRFLSALRDRDRDLFRQEFTLPLHWDVTAHSGHVDLTITPSGSAATTLHGRSSDQNNNIGYFQSGVPGNSLFAQIDAAHRANLATQFRNAVVWPHVQEIIVETSAWWLTPGLNQIHEPPNGIPALDSNVPDRDTFILKALLLSAFVRFSGCLAPLLERLRPWATVQEKLRNIDAVLGSPGDWGGCRQSHKTHLRSRLAAQRPDAQRVHDMIGRIRSGHAGEEWEDFEERPEYFDLSDDFSLESDAEMSNSLPCGGREQIDEAVGVLNHWGEALVSFADEALKTEATIPYSTWPLESALQHMGIESVAPTGGRLSAADLFDAFARPARRGLAEHYSRYLEVVAAPGKTVTNALRPGDLLIERALGEGNVARLSVVSGTELMDAHETEEAGLEISGGRGGLYVRVVESGVSPRTLSEGFGRNITRPDGRLRASQMVLRLKEPLIGEQAGNPSACTPGSAATLHADVVAGITNSRTLTGLNLKISSPVCSPTRMCPPRLQPFHNTVDASHFVGLGKDELRVLGMSGLFGLDLSGVNGLSKKAAQSVKTIAVSPPLGNLTFAAIRRDGQREVHIDRRDLGRWGVVSMVDGDTWKCLPFEAHPGVIYTLMKMNWPRASLHRQWGKEAAIAWIKALCNFYLDQTGLRLGIGDISHIAGEEMNDEHHSHRAGIDVDLYVIDYSGGSAFPDAVLCDGDTGALRLSMMLPPADDAQRYRTGGAVLTGAGETAVWQRFATVLAYCFTTWDRVNAIVWHGIRNVQTEAVAIGQAAFDAGWRPTWGPAPSDRSAINIPGPLRGTKLIGMGAGSYNRSPGWPLHRDHIHIRLSV